MSLQVAKNEFRQSVPALLVGLALVLVSGIAAAAQTSYQTGDRVECEVTGNVNGKFWEKGTVLSFRPGDQPDGSWFRVKADSNKVEYYCKLEHIRPISGAAKPQQAPEPRASQPNSSQTEAKGDPAPLNTDFVECPVKQKQVKNGTRPDEQIVRRLIRCNKGEKAVDPGDEGAVRVEISAIRIGAARPWSYRQDSGNGKLGTIVYPVKATYTVKTLYRTAIEVEDGWVRILNFYVNAFGEWAIGSEENVTSPKVGRIVR
jgi:hypothetical protein